MRVFELWEPQQITQNLKLVHFSELEMRQNASLEHSS